MCLLMYIQVVVDSIVTNQKTYDKKKKPENIWWMKGFRVENGVHKERMETRREKRVRVVQKKPKLPFQRV